MSTASFSQVSVCLPMSSRAPAGTLPLASAMAARNTVMYAGTPGFGLSTLGCIMQLCSCVTRHVRSASRRSSSARASLSATSASARYSEPESRMTLAVLRAPSRARMVRLSTTLRACLMAFLSFFSVWPCFCHRSIVALPSATSISMPKPSRSATERIVSLSRLTFLSPSAGAMCSSSLSVICFFRLASASATSAPTARAIRTASTNSGRRHLGSASFLSRSSRSCSRWAARASCLSIESVRRFFIRASSCCWAAAQSTSCLRAWAMADSSLSSLLDLMADANWSRQLSRCCSCLSTALASATSIPALPASLTAFSSLDVLRLASAVSRSALIFSLISSAARRFLAVLIPMPDSLAAGIARRSSSMSLPATAALSSREGPSSRFHFSSSLRTSSTLCGSRRPLRVSTHTWAKAASSFSSILMWAISWSDDTSSCACALRPLTVAVCSFSMAPSSVDAFSAVATRSARGGHSCTWSSARCRLLSSSLCALMAPSSARSTVRGWSMALSRALTAFESWMWPSRQWRTIVSNC